MWNYISYFKEIIIWSLPFYFLHLYLNNVYQLSLGQLLSWWFRNFTSTDSSTAISISFVLIFLLFCLPFTSLFNSFYLSLFGEKQTLVYLGNSSSNISNYYKQFDESKKTFTGYNIDKKLNYNFSDLNKLKYFIKDPRTNNIVGQKNKRIHLSAIASTFFFMMFLLLPALGVIHALTYPMYIETFGENTQFQGEAVNAFETVLLKLNISKGVSVLIFFGSLVFALYFSGKIPGEKNSIVTKPLPENIKPNNYVTATPVEINIVYEKPDRNSESKMSQDSGYRDVIFRFDKGFDPSVYVTLNYDTREHPNLEDKFKQLLTNQGNIDLVINENLGLRLDYKFILD